MSHFKDITGLTIYIETSKTITGATSIVLNVTKPSGTKVTWIGAVVEGTTQLKYLTIASDLDEDGWYLIYPSFTLGDWQGKGSPDRFLIRDASLPDKTYGI